MTTRALNAAIRIPAALSLSLLVQTAVLQPIPDKLVVLTFDDSKASHYSVVRPLLKKYGFGATFFITEGFSFATNKDDYLTWDQIAELHRDGFEIGNHTRDHMGVSKANLPRLREQVDAINARCASHGVPRPTSFAYPGNAIDPGGLRILEELGFRFARRGGAPEYPYEDGNGVAYEPGRDHPLLLPSAGDARPFWTLENLKRATSQAQHGKIAILQFHGEPDVEHPWVHTPRERFEEYMTYLHDGGFKVIALRDLAKYVDWRQKPDDPWKIIEQRRAELFRQPGDAPQTPRAQSVPLALHPDNPHYFLWRGKPAVLIGSGEHYGALLNLDFDYRRYFDTLAADGMMLTRVFSGAYVEPEGAFNIARNTLAPAPGRFISPWARSDQPGYANGGNRFDLGRWDEAYFRRLADLAAYAAEKGIVIELTLFCPMYEDTQWNLSPMNARNNINGVGNIGRLDVHTLDRHGGLLPVEEALVRKLVTVLNPMDNVMFEIMNEPYAVGVPMAWQHHIADVIVETERGLPNKHVISQNVANKTAAIEAPHAGVSVFNFHYAAPPDAVATNYHIGKVIGDNETGFRGTSDAPYRLEAWDFIVSGGGLFNNLDYSFAAGYETGTFGYPASQPGGGNAGFRRQMKVLRDFIHGFDFVHMRPDDSVIAAGVPVGVTARALVDSGRAMAIFVRGGGASTVVSVQLAAGAWTAEWIDTKTGATARSENVTGGGIRPLEAPVYESDIALRLVKQGIPNP